MTDTFEVLLKSARTERDTASAAMNSAADQLQRARQLIVALDAAADGARSNAECTFSAGTYVRDIVRRKRRILEQVPSLERRLLSAQQALVNAFSQVKKLEFVKQRRELHLAKAQSRLEQIVLDDIGMRGATDTALDSDRLPGGD